MPHPHRLLARRRDGLAAWGWGALLARILEEFVRLHHALRQGVRIAGCEGLRVEAMAPAQQGAVVALQRVRQQLGGSPCTTPRTNKTRVRQVYWVPVKSVPVKRLNTAGHWVQR